MRLHVISDLRGLQSHLRFRQTGDKRRQIPGKFFMRRAFDANAKSTMNNLRRLILEAVDETVKAEAAKAQKVAA